MAGISFRLARAALQLGAASLAMLAGAAGNVAQARGGVVFSLGVPAPYPYPPPPPPAYYYPYYQPPPPVVYAPPPALAAPPLETVQQTCREYQAPATIGGVAQSTHGVACLRPDGSWRVVR